MLSDLATYLSVPDIMQYTARVGMVGQKHWDELCYQFISQGVPRWLKEKTGKKRSE